MDLMLIGNIILVNHSLKKDKFKIQVLFLD